MHNLKTNQLEVVPDTKKGEKMKHLRKFCIVLLTAGIIFGSCNKNEKHPSLRVVNGLSGSTITSISLVGYEFKTLSISSGQSQTFTLDKGMSAGNDNIYISVTYNFGGYSPSRTISNKFNFKNGAITSIKLHQPNTGSIHPGPVVLTEN